MRQEGPKFEDKSRLKSNLIGFHLLPSGVPADCPLGVYFSGSGDNSIDFPGLSAVSHSGCVRDTASPCSQQARTSLCWAICNRVPSGTGAT